MLRAMALVVGVAVVVTGCATSGERSEQPTSASADPKPRAFDPPTQFTASGRPQPLDGYVADQRSPQAEPAFAVTGTTVASVTEKGASVVDVRRGTTATVGPDQVGDSSGAVGSEVETQGAGRAVAARLAGKTYVLAAYRQTVRGSGTSKEFQQVRVQAIDVASQKVAWAVDTKVAPYKFDGAAGVGGVYVDEGSGVIAVDGGRVLKGDSLDTQNMTVVVDAVKHKTLWQSGGMKAVGVNGDVVAAVKAADDVTEGTLVGLDSDSQQQKWTGVKGSYFAPAASRGEYTAVVHRSSSGKTVVTTANAKGVIGTADTGGSVDPYAVQCVDDRRSIIACSSPPGEELQTSNDNIVAIDTKTGKKAWGYTKDGGRTVPDVRSAFHGVVYAETDDGPVLMDATTGKDKPTKISVAPRAVNEYAAAAITEGTGTEGSGGSQDWSVNYFKTAG